MEVTMGMRLFCCAAMMLAGIVDSIAGGGGLITLPAFIAVGLPVHLAYGTNKFAAACGSASATVTYHRGGGIRWDLAPVAVLAAFVGAWCGSQLVLILSDRVLRICMMVLLPVVAVFSLANRSLGKETEEKHFTKRQLMLRLFAVGFGVGIYDGFFGPAAGTFYMLGFTLLIGLSLYQASGTAKVINLASNAAALVSYLLSGNVLFTLAIPCALCSIVGNYIGSKLARRVGAPLIRRVMGVVLIGLLAKVVFDFFA